MGTRDFSNQFRNGIPEERTVDDNAPVGLRLELIDIVFNFVQMDTTPYPHAITEGQLYRALKHSMGLALAPDNPMNGFRNGAARQIRDLPWQRVLDLICRWFREFPRELQPEYVHAVNRLLASYRIAWDLSEDGTFHRVLPSPVRTQIDAALGELGNPRYGAALDCFREAQGAYNDRPQRGRDACKNIFDALESVAKEVFHMPTATFGDVLTQARRRQLIAHEAIAVLQKLYDMSNSHFRHGMTTAFTLRPAEVDFVMVSSMAGILLFTRLPARPV